MCMLAMMILHKNENDLYVNEHMCLKDGAGKS